MGMGPGSTRRADRWVMDLEWHQLDLRYEGLRSRSPARERRLLASLAAVGQQTPIVVVPSTESERYVVVDGYKRVRTLRQLKQDSVRAVVWELEEAEALWLERMMRTSEADSALAQGWFLHELHERFHLSLEELARRFDRSPSWVSRRLSLVRELPEEIQDHVRRGELQAHAAMKYFVPLARANRQDCLRLAQVIADKRLSSREVGELYGAWRAGTEKTRALLFSDPLLVLRARQEAQSQKLSAKDPIQLLLADLGILGAVARRALRRLHESARPPWMTPERDAVGRSMRHARSDTEELFAELEREATDAGPKHTHCDPPPG